MKRWLTLAAATVVLGATYVVVAQAFGGPSLATLVGRAQHLAREADSRATTALHRADAGPHLIYVSQDVSVAPQAFKQAILHCPAGYLVAGSATINGATQAVGESVAAAAVQFDGYNPSTTKTFGYTAEINCIKSNGFNTTPLQAVAASPKLAQAEREFRVRLRPGG